MLIQIGIDPGSPCWQCRDGWRMLSNWGTGEYDGLDDSVNRLIEEPDAGINQLGWTWMSRSSVGNQILRELYEDIQYVRITRCWLQSATVGSLRWPESSLWCRIIGTDPYDGLNDSVSSDLRTQHRINRFDGNMIRWRSRVSLESLCCRLEMASGCRGKKLERDEHDFDALNQVISEAFAGRSSVSVSRLNTRSQVKSITRRTRYIMRLLCQSSTRRAGPGGLWQF